MPMKKKKFLLLITLILILLTASTVNAYQNQAKNTNNESPDTLLEKITENYRITNDTHNRLFTIKEEEIINNTTDNNKFDKSRPIYFAMDHVNANDEQIRDTIVNRLKEEGFNVVSAEIGPNKMSNDTLYLYEHNISNAIIFHLFNGVDPSTIRELGTNGNDNRGRIVRSNGNDVVLAWFYDSVDCVNENGSGRKMVYGSETGPSMENPKEFMDENDIIGICTSSDQRNHTGDADYTGEKTVNEFIKLFND